MIIDKALILSSALIKNSSGKILLLQRSDKASFDQRWQLVEGKVEENEDPSAAVCREIEEETSQTATKCEFLDVSHSTLQANKIKYLVIRVLFRVKLSSLKIKISDEHIQFGWFSMEEISELDLLPGTIEAIKKAVNI